MLWISVDLGFFWVLGRKSETKPTRLDFEKKDPSSTAGVVESAGGRPGSDRIYQVDQVCGWVGHPYFLVCFN